MRVVLVTLCFVTNLQINGQMQGKLIFLQINVGVISLECFRQAGLTAKCGIAIKI